MYSPQTPENTAFELGHRYYELSNHLGNVLTVISDVKTPVSSGGNVASYTANIVNISDYSPFGVQLDGRTITSDRYRYGFQGQEKDDELKGEGNSINYTFRIHDPRVGRFFAIDPLAPKYPWYTPYQFSGNKLISFVELEGLEEANVNGIYEKPRSRWYGSEGSNEWNIGDTYYSSTGTIWRFDYDDNYNETWIKQADLKLDDVVVIGNKADYIKNKRAKEEFVSNVQNMYADGLMATPWSGYNKPKDPIYDKLSDRIIETDLPAVDRPVGFDDSELGFWGGSNPQTGPVWNWSFEDLMLYPKEFTYFQNKEPWSYPGAEGFDSMQISWLYREYRSSILQPTPDSVEGYTLESFIKKGQIDSISFEKYWSSEEDK